MFLASCLPAITESLHRGWEEKLLLLSVLQSESCSWWCLVTTFLSDSEKHSGLSLVATGVLRFFSQTTNWSYPWLETNSAQHSKWDSLKIKKKWGGTGQKQILIKKPLDYVMFLLTGEGETSTQFQANRSDPCFTNLRSVGQCSGAVSREEWWWWLLLFFALCYLNVNSWPW